MIIGVGIDIVDLEDFRVRLSDALISEVFLPGEIEHSASRARPWESFGARFAAKEAAFKALGAGLSQGVGWKDVEVVRRASGEVELSLSGRALAVAAGRGLGGARLSIAHSARSAVAVVILEGWEE